jgi:hypothetical protein
MTKQLIAREEFGMCRVVNHLWQRDGLERHGRDVLLSLTCASCGTVREDLVDLSSGEVERRYRYAKDYVTHLEEGEQRPYKADYRREWMRVLLQEETGRVVRLPARRAS